MGFTLNFYAVNLELLNNCIGSKNPTHLMTNMKRIRNSRKEGFVILGELEKNTDYLQIWRAFEQLCRLIGAEIDYDEVGYHNFQDLDETLEEHKFPRSFRIQTVIGQFYSDDAEADQVPSEYNHVKDMMKRIEHLMQNAELTVGFISPATLHKARMHYLSLNTPSRNEETGEASSKRCRIELDDATTEFVNSLFSPQLLYGERSCIRRKQKVSFAFKINCLPYYLIQLILSYSSMCDLVVLQRVNKELNLRATEQIERIGDVTKHVGMICFFS